MVRKHNICLTLIIFIQAVSCSRQNNVPVQMADTVAVTTARQSNLLWTDAELEAENGYNERAEELFDDFLYNYIQDTVMQRERAVFPLNEQQADGSIRQISESDWNDEYYFTPTDYTTSLYNSEAEMSINEDTSLWSASVEKIDLMRESVTAYDFLRNDERWKLVSIRNMSYADSDLNDFLCFYSRFVSDSTFRSRSLSASIHISMMESDDDTQVIDGFITREQWPTIGCELPEGTIMNIRYGQQYLHSKRILMEKISMGDGMSEIFIFAKGSRGWELVGFEN